MDIQTISLYLDVLISKVHCSLCTSGAGPVLFKDRELQEEVGLDYIIKVGAELELESKD